MKKILLLSLLFGATTMLSAQQNSVIYDYANNWFNQGGNIPAESNFTINGQVPKQLSKVAIEIRKNGNDNILYETSWNRPMGNSATSFSLPVKYKLRSSSLYDFDLKFYRLTTAADKANIKNQLYTALDGYVDGVVEMSKSKITFSRQADVMMDDLYSIVDASLQFYEPITGFDFPGFSDIVRLKINQIDDTRLSLSKVIVGKSKDDTKSEVQRELTQKLLKELKELLRNEVSPYVMQDAYVLSEVRELTEVGTDNTINYITLQGGYGVIYSSGKLSNANYYESPYVGVVLPLGKPAFAPEFIQKASINAGIFLNEFTATNGETVSGPIVNRPVYVGLGYNLIKFVKFNAGAVFLENKSTTDGISLNLENVRVRPFIGLSAQIKLSGKLDF